jgi:hypothetical protein
MTRKSLNVIFTSVFLWNVAAAMSLLEGRFVTITNVEGIVNLSLDFEEMQKNGDANITSLYREVGFSGDSSFNDTKNLIYIPPYIYCEY